MLPKTGSLAELSAMLEGKLPLTTLTEFLKPVPFGYPQDIYEDWALDKAKFVSEKFTSTDNRKLNVFGRILVQRSLLTFFPEGPYTSVDKLSKARRKLEKSGIVMAQFHWPEETVDYLLQKSHFPWMARHVEGENLNPDETSAEFKKSEENKQFVKDSGALLYNQPAVLYTQTGRFESNQTIN